jgi:CDP-diacylglycerol--serine O-phosphatidyltransferase
VARRLNATSRFGVEFDSLSDLVSFGIAPAFLAYNWCYRVTADEFGVVVCFLYIVCAASRLARFNITESNLKSFTGLPTPAAAGVVVASVNVLPQSLMDFNPPFVGAVTLLMLSLSFLMVSRFEFFSIKKVKLSGPSLNIPWLIAPAIVLVWYNNKIGFLVITLLYAASGPFSWVKSRSNRTSVEGAMDDESDRHEGNGVDDT